MHLSYADDCLALLNACVIDYEWMKEKRKMFSGQKMERTIFFSTYRANLLQRVKLIRKVNVIGFSE